MYFYKVHLFHSLFIFLFLFYLFFYFILLAPHLLIVEILVEYLPPGEQNL